MQDGESRGQTVQGEDAMAQAAARGKRSSRAHAGVVGAMVSETFGAPSYDRRLTDKILAAFNHAYATGAVKTATHLKAVLAEVEVQERTKFTRRNSSAVGQADLWMAFVEARNRYNALSEGGDAPAQAEAALAAMKDAYRAWSDAV